MKHWIRKLRETIRWLWGRKVKLPIDEIVCTHCARAIAVNTRTKDVRCSKCWMPFDVGSLAPSRPANRLKAKIKGL